MTNSKAQDLGRFYELLDELERKVDGARMLNRCDGRMDWPQRGVYFFREPGEERTTTGPAPRIVRVGTHALKPGSRASLWKRLSQHKGTAKSGGGNHRGSIFRLLVGTALMKRDGFDCPSWGKGSSAPREIRQCELVLEQAVSREIGAMPFLWLEIRDEPGPDSRRGFIERNSIALLSHLGKAALDAPSPRWLGLGCNRKLVRTSGLWNNKHVKESYNPAFLDTMEHLTHQMEPRQ